MKKFFWLIALSLTAVGAAWAGEHAYSKMTTPKTLMAHVVKPNLDKLVEMRKAGGPQAMDDWKTANALASLIGESGQLMLMQGWVKDQAWSDGSVKLVEGAKAAMTAANSQDVNGFNAGIDGMSQGCRTCHTVHKPKK